MSEEVLDKQYILMVSEINMLLLGKVIPGIQFLEVQGMNVTGNEGLQLLATPIVKPPEPKATMDITDGSISAPS